MSAETAEIRSNTELPARRTDVELVTDDHLTLVGELAEPLDRRARGTIVTLHPLPTAHLGGGAARRDDDGDERGTGHRSPSPVDTVRADPLDRAATGRREVLLEHPSHPIPTLGLVRVPVRLEWPVG